MNGKLNYEKQIWMPLPELHLSIIKPLNFPKEEELEKVASNLGQHHIQVENDIVRLASTVDQMEKLEKQ